MIVVNGKADIMMPTLVKVNPLSVTLKEKKMLYAEFLKRDHVLFKYLKFIVFFRLNTGLIGANKKCTQTQNKNIFFIHATYVLEIWEGTQNTAKHLIISTGSLSSGIKRNNILSLFMVEDRYSMPYPLSLLRCQVFKTRCILSYPRWISTTIPRTRKTMILIRFAYVQKRSLFVCTHQDVYLVLCGIQLRLKSIQCAKQESFLLHSNRQIGVLGWQ